SSRIAIRSARVPRSRRARWRAVIRTSHLLEIPKGNLHRVRFLRGVRRDLRLDCDGVVHPREVDAAGERFLLVEAQMEDPLVVDALLEGLHDFRNCARLLQPPPVFLILPFILHMSCEERQWVAYV